MPRTITISPPEEIYKRLQGVGVRTHQSPEGLVLAAVNERYGTLAGTDAQLEEDPMIAVMRANGHLVDPAAYPPPPAADLPPYGSAEWTQRLEALGQEVSDALEQMGKSVADLVER